MRRSFGVWLLAAALPSVATAQTAQPPSYAIETRGFVTVDLGFQAADGESISLGTFDVYDETGSFEAQQSYGSGFQFSIGAVERIRGAFGVGLAFSRSISNQARQVSVTAPHPLIYDAPRSVTAQQDEGDHTENVLHFQAVWMVTISEQFEVAASAGPSIFFVSHDYVSSAGFEETGDPFTTIAIADVQTDSADETAFGFNVGIDVAYYASDTMGVGGFVRYAAAEADLDLGEAGRQKVDAGGFQAGAGLRVRW